jgi:hypothetical protein
MIDTRDLDAPPAADSDAEINGLADQPIALLRPDGVPPDALAELVLRLQKQLAQHRREWRRHAAVSTADREQLRGMLVRHLAEPPAVPERLGRRINALVIIVSGLVLLSWTDAVGTLERLGIPANASIAIAALAWAGYEIFGWRWPPARLPAPPRPIAYPPPKPRPAAATADEAGAAGDDEDVFAGGVDNGSDELRAMAATIWGEARGEPLDGKVAVGWVIRNRAANPGGWGRDIRGAGSSPSSQ